MYSEKIESIRRFLENSDERYINQEHIKPVYAILENLEESLDNFENNVQLAPQE